MKHTIIIPGVFSVAACLLIGCGQSSSSSNESAKTTPAPAPATAPQASPSPAAAPSADATPATTAATTPVTPPPSPLPTAPTPTPDNSQPAATAPTPAPDQSAASAATSAEPVAQFATTAAAQTDTVAASIGSELAAKAKSLTQSAGGNTELKTKLAGAMQSLSAGKDASALGTLFQQAKQSTLTPQQTQLVKDVGNLASAYVVQRNFSSLDGAQGDVATVVNSLRKGSVVPAVPALQSLAQNASLTAQQKDLLGTLADQYAPGLMKGTSSLRQGLQGLQGLTK